MYKTRGHNPIPILINNGNVLTEIKICLCHNVEQLKEKIQEKIGGFQTLYFNGKILDDKKKSIGELGIEEFSIIDLDGPIDYSDAKEKYKNELIHLKEMGFCNEEKNIRIIKVSAGNISYAIHHYYQYLINKFGLHYLVKK